MTDYPIIFSAAMIRALLDGRKTMTRRLAWENRWICACGWKGKAQRLVPTPAGGLACPGCGGTGGLHMTEAPTIWQKVRPGDRLWVRENFKSYFKRTPTSPGVIYMADCHDFNGNKLIHQMSRHEVKWTPSIHMPRWASRITLVVTDTKMEPLLDISEEDAIAEGFAAGQLDDGFGPRDIGGGWTVESPGTYAGAAGMFQIAWSNLHPDWDGYSSPEVVALTFRVVKANIDAMEKAA